MCVLGELGFRPGVCVCVGGGLSYGMIWDCPCMVVGNRFFATFSPCTETNGSRSSTLSFSACVGTLYKVTPATKKIKIELTFASFFKGNSILTDPALSRKVSPRLE